MLTNEENGLLTRIGPGTPGGEMMRRYWQPAALAEELPIGGPPIPVVLLGENLVLFRDSDGMPGLLGLFCPHRGADLSYGRLEDGGLRCIYHGWLFDRSGQCLEQPAEPADSTFYTRIKQTAYSCQEVGGVIFAYLGPGTPPLLPAYEFLSVPDENRFVTKIFSESNYLQGNEGNEPVHLSFLHRVNFKDGGLNALMVGDVAPLIEVDVTDWGVRTYAIRRSGDGTRYVRLTNTVMPNLTCFGGGPVDGHSVNWHVPIDDTHHWKYTFIFRRGGPLDKETTARGRAGMDDTYHTIRNKSNRYQQDRDEQKTQSYLGMGSIFQIHDLCATEARPIQDRSQEHLTRGDSGVIAMRKLLLAAVRDVQEGQDPRHVVRRPEDNSFPDLVTESGMIPEGLDFRDFWKPESRDVVMKAPAR